MSNKKDFVIKKGKLTEYVGPKSGDIVIPEEVTGMDGPPTFLDIMEGPFSLTLSGSMSCTVSNLLAQELTVLNIPAGATVTMVSDRFNANNGNPFFKNLEAIHVAEGHPTLSSENGLLYNKDKTVLLSCPRGVKGTVKLPETVTEIADEAFYGCSQVTEVAIPSGVTAIGGRAFADCKSLKKIVLPDKIKTIGKEAFLRCSKIKTAGLKGTGGKKGFDYEFPWTDAIPGNAFSGIKSLKQVTLPDSVQSIGKDAFKACANLEEINLSDNVTFDKKTFKDCTKLSF